MLMVAFMILYIIIRILKYRMFRGGGAVHRMTMNLYAIPTVMIPLMGFYAAASLGHAQNEKMKLWQKLLLILAAMMIILALTNDLHGLYYTYPAGWERWDDVLVMGPVRVLSLIWMTALFVAEIFLIARYVSVRENKQYVFVPVAFLLFAVLFFVWYYTGPYIFDRHIFQQQEAIDFLVVAMWESCFQIGLLATNKNHAGLFRKSSVGAMLTDINGIAAYKTERFKNVTAEELALTEQGSVMMTDGLRLRRREIHGGYVYWQDDLSAVLSAEEDLRDAASLLTEEVTVLNAENEAKEAKTKIDEQNRLYDKMSDTLRPQLEKIQSLLPKIRETDDNKLLAYVSVLGTYIKRRSNLMLIADKQNEIDADELYFAISESLEYLRLMGVYSNVNSALQGKADHNSITVLYDYFEQIIELSHGKLLGIDILLSEGNGSINMRLVLEPSVTVPEPAGNAFTAKSISLDESSAAVTVSVRKGGGRV